MKKNLNQKLIDLVEYYNLSNANLLISNNPLNRMKFNPNDIKSKKLADLKKKIESIRNCELKKNATNLVFGDGNINS